MTDHIPPTSQPLNLDDIEAVTAAATPGPWGVYEYGGDSLIEIAADLEDTGTGYRARRTVCRLDEEPLDNDPTHREWSAEEDWAQVRADAKFIATMSPETVKAMAAEIRRLRAEKAQERAYGIRYAAGLVEQAFHGAPFLSYPPDFAEMLREHADRLLAVENDRRAAVPAAVETGH
jgi:hypothetical protein